MIDMRVHAALPDDQRARMLDRAATVQRMVERQRAELLLAEAMLITMRHFGDQVDRLLVITGPCWFGDRALISEITAVDGTVLWAALRRDHPAGAPWDGEDAAQEYITKAWSLASSAFHVVDEGMGLHEIRLHRAEVAR